MKILNKTLILILLITLPFSSTKVISAIYAPGASTSAPFFATVWFENLSNPNIPVTAVTISGSTENACFLNLSNYLASHSNWTGYSDCRSRNSRR